MRKLCGTILAAAMAANGAEWISVPGAPVYRGAVKDGIDWEYPDLGIAP